MTTLPADGSAGEGDRNLIHVVLLDVDLGEPRGTESLVRARQLGLQQPSLVLTAGIPDREWQILPSLGSASLVRTDASVEHLWLPSSRRRSAGRCP